MLSPAPNPRRQPAWLAVFLVFALALAVRLIGLGWGLPNASRWYSYHPDESTHQIVGAVAGLIGGDFNPHFFNYPSLSIYATWVFYQFLVLSGLTTNLVQPTDTWPYIHDIILAGRLFSVVCGAATAPLVGGIARRLGMGRWAILAAVLAALAPGHVQHSHFATVDVPSTFFVTLCLFLTLRAESWKGLLGAALVAGLAAGTKYNAGLVVVAPIVQGFLLAGKEGALKAALTAAASVVVSIFGFLISTPYALLAPREFWGDDKANGFYYEAFVHPKIGSGDIFQGTGNGWWYHFSFNLPFLLTWPLVVVALVGIGFAGKKRQFWPILAFSGLFFFSLGLSQVRFMRYLLPLVPMLCLLAAWGASRLRFRRVWGVVLATFALLGCKDVLWPFVRVDPRDQAAAMMVSGKRGLASNPWYYTPPFQPQGLNRPVADVVTTGFDAKRVSAAHLDWFALSEYEWREQQRLGSAATATFLQGLEQELTRADRELAIAKQKRFKNFVPFALPGRNFVPHDYLYTNPETRVYWFGWNRQAPAPK